ncbi:FAD dependent oxidoreductase [Butyrivibrio fibrisolvens DSM 3071]|uniref:FAD dependent oxidoreductase n=1 Tax=Butyrivibrio fibrisolvens DSM 3071 TaxID=1121131 RepID=A0A1M6A9W1_BUTFI|nr:FAD-dependent oxidoreductase [Butyrivibrio fibrisolvens]SHI33250.1 FAD dependent oxidoreductase [Butyrivibrio fibrisolvens DSM 3071]
METYDKIIIGAGLYGLYSALFCCKKGQNVIILECDNAPFKRATYINQARVHQGYHYPRSISTAMKSAGYFERFNKDYAFCVNKEFDQIYATSSQYSWSDGQQFKDFCKAANIPCEELHASNYFKEGMCDGVFRTREYTYDAMILKDYLLDELAKYPDQVTIRYGAKISEIIKESDAFIICDEDGSKYKSGFVLNSTYAGTNQILEMAGFEKFGIKYELCEIILCDVNDKLKNVGFTVMDGPFFSIMPFGKTGFHSLTSVTFTPHTTSYDQVPTFTCQDRSEGHCSVHRLGNCNDCPAKPTTAFPYMANLARKYMLDSYEFEYRGSLFSMKPILMSSEIDDSRPTVIRTYSKNPTFVGVLSGKINTVYDLDEVLTNG